MNFEEGDLVMCTVDRIVGTIVFVNIEGGSEGSIVTSEIAPGRIRNLRDYVVPKKKIVCKVLRVSNDRVDLSLRRVTQKEKKEVLQKCNQESSYKSIFRTVLKDKAEKIIEEISKKESLCEFLQKAKENPKELKQMLGEKDSEKVLEIINKQKNKKSSSKKELFLTTASAEGISLIKKALDVKDAEIKYLSAGRYSIKTEADDIKLAEIKIRQILSQIESVAKKEGMEFKVKEK